MKKTKHIICLLMTVLAVQCTTTTLSYAGEGQSDEPQISLEEEKEASPLESITDPDGAKKGIVQVNCVYEDESGEYHVICGGSGFLIGDGETQYVITCYHITNPDKELRDTAFTFLNISEEQEEWDSIGLQLQVVMENDVVTSASIVKSSRELDMSVLKLSEAIHTKATLTIATADENSIAGVPYKVTDKIYALGYPESIRYDSEHVFYNTEQVTMSTGSIVNLAAIDNVQMIEHDAQVGENNSGGPLVNAKGQVIGMNVPVRDGNYYCSVDSTAICRVLDAVGLSYEKTTTSEIEENRKKEEENTPDETEVEQSLPRWIIYAFIGMMVLVALLVILLIISLAKGTRKTPEEKEKIAQEKARKKKEKANARIKTPELPEAIKDQESIKHAEEVAGGMDTSLLSAGNNTTLLSGGAFVDGQHTLSGTLIRHKTAENILLTKQIFVIGKDSLHVDYYIKDNSAISRKHAEIIAKADGAYLNDCHSTNGTFLNNKRVSEGHPQLLTNGDVIRLANEEFDYRI